MMYLKLCVGPGNWSLYEAEHLDWSSTYLEVPDANSPVDRDWGKFLKDREMRVHPHMHVSTPMLGPDVHCFDPQDQCIRVAHRLDPNGEWWTHIFQGPAFVLGESGQTIEKL